MNWREVITPKNAFLAFILTLIIIFSRQLATVFFPFVSGLILAAFLEPIIVFLEKNFKLPRSIAVMGTLTTAVVVFTYLLIAVTSKMIVELIDLASLLPQYRESIVFSTNELFFQFERFSENLPEVVSLNIQRSIEDFLKTLESATKDLINRVLAMFASLPIFIVITLVVIVSTYFISKDKNLLTNTFMNLVPENWRNRIDNTKERIAVDLIGFIKGRLLLLIIATLVAAIGLMLINTRYWMIIAVIIGILDNIPIVGPGSIFGPWIGLNILVGDTERAFYLTILYFLIFSSRQLIEPKIMGASIGIHPLAMLLALYGGIVFFGVLGIFIGPILLIIIKASFHAGLFSKSFPE